MKPIGHPLFRRTRSAPVPGRSDAQAVGAPVRIYHTLLPRRLSEEVGTARCAVPAASSGGTRCLGNCFPRRVGASDSAPERRGDAAARRPYLRWAYDVRAGFSLLEIMVAVALLAIIIVGLLAMFYQVQRAFRAGTTQVDVMENGRAAMGVFTRELQEAAATGVKDATNLVIVPAYQAILNSQKLSSGDDLVGFLYDLCFLQRHNDDWTGLAYRFTNAASGVGTLYRYAWSWRRDTNPAWNDDTNSAMSRVVCRLPPHPPSPSDQWGSVSPVLDGVVHFRVEAFDAEGLSYRTYSNIDDGHLRFDNNNDVYAFLSTNLPAYVDIELRVLEPSALAKFRARAEIDQARANTYLTGLIGQTHVFRQRIPLRPAATSATRF